jgi:hypothetical protein
MSDLSFVGSRALYSHCSSLSFSSALSRYSKKSPKVAQTSRLVMNACEATRSASIASIQNIRPPSLQSIKSKLSDGSPNTIQFCGKVIAWRSRSVSSIGSNNPQFDENGCSENILMPLPLKNFAIPKNRLASAPQAAI